MKKTLLLVLCFMLVVPALAYAQCPNYEIGYKGNAKACIFGITMPLPGATVQMSTPENGIVCDKVTDAAGKYTCKVKINNCANEFGFYTQQWSVTVDANILGIPLAKTCNAKADFICCCPQCVQSIIKTCRILYKFCC
ncbi:MAG: hypothetical protein P8168_06545 [Deltaproteobacteria bacterium]|jgi:hypothetical protein